MPAFPHILSVPLRNTPLELVVCQMRFPQLLSLASAEPPIQFGKRVRDRYPLTQTHRGAAGSSDFDTVPSSVWAFEDKESAWTVTLSSEFLSLETSRYTSRAEFLGRFLEVARILNELYQVPLCERLGVRYLDRVGGAQDLPPDWPRRMPRELIPALGLQAPGERCSTNSEFRFHGLGQGLALRVGFVDRGGKVIRLLNVLLGRPEMESLLYDFFGFPKDMPDLSRLRPEGNSRPDGVNQSFFARGARNELPLTY